MNPYIKTCKNYYCRREFEARRSNNEYCCPEHKSKQNNRIARNRRNRIKAIQNILVKNMLILERLSKRDGVTVKWEELAQLGFQYKYHTHQVLTEDKSKWIQFYYTLGLLKLENNNFQIIKP